MKNYPSIYLDYNATTSVDSLVLQAIVEGLSQDVGNPSSIHFHGQQTNRLLNTNRLTIAKFFKCDPKELIFTSGGTECANLLLQGLMKKYSQGHLITSAVEHACVYETAKALEKKGYEVSYLKPGLNGSITAEAVKQAIRPDTKLISLMAVNNETGVKTDIQAIAEIAKLHGIAFIVDGVAWLGKEVLHIPPGVSAIFFSGHKIHAIKGIGVCICKKPLKLSPLFYGGEQEFNRRPGTENMAGIIAFAKALEILEQTQAQAIIEMKNKRDDFESQLKSQLMGVIVNGQGERICNTSNLSFENVDGETLLMLLDQAGISASHGSACSSGALEPSRILLNMDIPLSLVRSSIRFSIGRTTSQEDINQAVHLIVKFVKQLREYSR